VDAADPTVRPVKTVLIICHANTARSVMAHVLLERMLAERDLADRIRVRSGGIANYARDGMLPSLDARIVLREEGIHLGEDGLTSTDLKRHPYLLAEADLILTMTTAQKEMLAAFPEATGRPTYTLREFAGAPGDIDDPAMQGEDVFRTCREEIKQCLGPTADRLLALFPLQSTERTTRKDMKK
jgi:protein-tyrosine-phosphatase